MLKAATGQLPACCQPGLILHPAPRDEPRSPRCPQPSRAVTCRSPQCPAVGGQVVEEQPTSHPSPSRTTPDQAMLPKRHSPTLHLGSELGKGCFFPSLGKTVDFKGSLSPPRQPQVQPGVNSWSPLPESTWVISRHLDPCSDINPFPGQIKRKAGWRVWFLSGHDGVGGSISPGGM